MPQRSRQRLTTPYGNTYLGLPKIQSQIVIEGHQSTIERDGDMSITHVLAIASSGELTLHETTISGNPSNADAWDQEIGGILNYGLLTLNKSKIVNCRYAPGIFNDGGTVTLITSAVSNNRFNSHGGGIENVSGTIALVNSVVSENAGDFRGGGISNRGTAVLINSAVSDNWISYEGNGGGIKNYGELMLIASRVSNNRADFSGGLSNEGVAHLINTSVFGNTAYSDYYPGGGGGGGIGNSATLTLTNSTISGNNAGYGAGINQYIRAETDRRTLTLVNSTMTGNVANVGGGGGLSLNAGATVTLKRSLISGNTADSGPEIHNDGAQIIADYYNLFGHDGDAGVVGFTPGPRDIVASVPVADILLPLADNGGRSLTHALAINSPALDAIAANAECPATDQRGAVRPQGAGCDIGAFEGSAVRCDGRITTHVGTAGRDDLSGTPGADVIHGLGGDDVIRGLQGDDILCAGSGADQVFAGNGQDRVWGGPGNDRLFGQRGDDVLKGGPGIDVCDGQAGRRDRHLGGCETVINVP